MKKSYTTLLGCLLFALSSFAQPAPDFTITGTDGQQHQLYADYLNQGMTVVLKVMFVACPSCNDIAPSTEVLYQDWGGGNNDVEFFSLSDKSYDSNADVLGYEQMHGLTYPGAGADGGSLTAVAPYKNGTYGPFFGTPTFVVIAPDGTVNFDVVGAGIPGTINALDAAIEATGAVRPGSQVFYSVSGRVHNENDQNISNVEVALNDMSTPVVTGTDGEFSFGDVAASTLVNLEPAKNINPLNGITAFDLVTMQKHILRIQSIPSPYRIIAADVNKSKTISSFDIVLLRKLILYIDTEFSGNTSWRFIPDSFTFPNPQNPFQTNFPESIDIGPLGQNISGANFTGLKVGDVSGNANPNMLLQSEGRSLGELTFAVEDQQFKRDELIEVPFMAKDFHDVIAFQFTLDFDTDLLNFAGIQAHQATSKIQMDEGHFGLSHLSEGMLTACWNDIEGISLTNDEVLFTLRFRAKQTSQLAEALSIQSSLTAAEAFDPQGNSYQLQLAFRPTNIKVFSVLQLSPNLISQEAILSFELKNEGPLQIDILTTDGQLIDSQTSTRLAVGLHQKILNMEHLANGAYLLRVRQGNEPVRLLRFVVAR